VPVQGGLLTARKGAVNLSNKSSSGDALDSFSGVIPEPCYPLGDETWVDADSGLVLELGIQDLKSLDKPVRVREGHGFGIEEGKEIVVTAPTPAYC
jgi:hypothetical protein